MYAHKAHHIMCSVYTCCIVVTWKPKSIWENTLYTVYSYVPQVIVGSLTGVVLMHAGCMGEAKTTTNSYITLYTCTTV